MLIYNKRHCYLQSNFVKIRETEVLVENEVVHYFKEVMV